MLFFLFFLSAHFLFAQANNSEYSKQAREFIDWRFKRINSHILGENLDTFTFNQLKASLLRGTFYRKALYDTSKTVVVDTFCFSEEERKYVDSFFSNPANFKIDTGLLNNSIILPTKIIDSLFKNSLDLSAYLNEKYHKDRFFYISKPIFLRNNTMCLFYDSSIRGGPLGDDGTFVIYIKDKTGWKIYCPLYGWLS